MKQQPGSDISSLQTRDKLQQRGFTPRKYASLEPVWKDRPRAVPHTVNSRTWVTGRKTKGSLASPSVYRRRRGHQFPGACRLRHCHPPSQPVANPSPPPAWPLLSSVPLPGGRPQASGAAPRRLGAPGRAGPGPKVSPRRAPRPGPAAPPRYRPGFSAAALLMVADRGSPGGSGEPGLPQPRRLARLQLRPRRGVRRGRLSRAPLAARRCAPAGRCSKRPNYKLHAAAVSFSSSLSLPAPFHRRAPLQPPPASA